MKRTLFALFVVFVFLFSSVAFSSDYYDPEYRVSELEQGLQYIREYFYVLQNYFLEEEREYTMDEVVESVSVISGILDQLAY